MSAARILNYFSLTMLGLVSVLPFLYPFHLFPQTSFYGEWMAFVLGMAGCAVFLMRSFWTGFDVPRISIYVMALILVIAIQGLTLSQPYKAQALLPALYLGWAVLLIQLAVWLRASIGVDKVVIALCWFALIGSLLHAITGIVQYLGVAGWLDAFVAIKKQNSPVYGNIVHPNQFATHLTLGSIALIYLYSQRRLSTALGFCLLAFLALMLALSGSRAVLIYAISMVLLSFATYRKQPDAPRLRLLTASLVLLAAFIGAQYLAIWMKPWLLKELADISLNAEPFTHNVALERMPDATSGIETRVSEWLKAWRMFLEAPLLGVGMGNYAWHSFQYQLLPEFSHVAKPFLFSHSHNLFAQALAETGAVGLGILLALIIGWVWQFRKAAFSLSGWFIATVLLVLFVHSNLEFPLWYSYFLGIAAVMLGLGDERTVHLAFTPWLGQVCAGLALFLSMVILFFTLAGFTALTKAEASYFETDAQGTIDTVLRISNNPLLEPYADMTLMVLMPLSKDGIEDKLRISTRVFKRNPNTYVAYKQAALLALNGQGREADELLEHSARMYTYALPKYIRMLKPVPDREVQTLRERAERLQADLLAARNEPLQKQ